MLPPKMMFGYRLALHGEKMRQVKRISSIDGKHNIDILLTDDGGYTLQWFISKYDPEEEVDYEIQKKPSPSSIFGDKESAIAEAKRLISIE